MRNKKCPIRLWHNTIVQPRKGRTMVRSGSIFSQLLRFISPIEFSQLVQKHHAEKASKGFKSWTQLVSMLFCHLAGAESLREICTGLQCCLGKLKHLGLSKSPSRSTLSYANANRPAEMFKELFWLTMGRFRNCGELGGKQHKFRFKNRLLSLDSTLISLCLNMFPWAKYRKAKGGVKAHVLLSHHDYMPSFVHLSNGKKADVKVAHLLNLQAGSIIAMDRAYNDYTLFHKWTQKGIFFVTRLKKNADYEVVEKRYAPIDRNILSDSVIRLRGVAGKSCPNNLRLIEVWDEKGRRNIKLLTNHLSFGPTTISAIYKDRWQIELFFKALKQNLKIKTFVGTTENALHIQIWTALLAMLLIRWCKHQSKAGWSFSLVATVLRWNLFVYRNLLDWLNDPMVWDVNPPPFEQQQLTIPGIGQHIVPKGGT